MDIINKDEVRVKNQGLDFSRFPFSQKTGSWNAKELMEVVAQCS